MPTLSADLVLAIAALLAATGPIFAAINTSRQNSGLKQSIKDKDDRDAQIAESTSKQADADATDKITVAAGRMIEQYERRSDFQDTRITVLSEQVEQLRTSSAAQAGLIVQLQAQLSAAVAMITQLTVRDEMKNKIISDYAGCQAALEFENSKLQKELNDIKQARAGGVSMGL